MAIPGWNGSGPGQAVQKAAYVKDPLLSRSAKAYTDLNPATDRGLPAKKVYRTTSIATLSFACYVEIVFLFYACFQTHPALVISLTFFTLIVALAEPIFISVYYKTKEWRKWIGRFGFLMSILGILVGLFLHYHWMVFYQHYRSMQTYTNLAASEDVLQYEDAGALVFSADTVVDIQRSVGYRDAKSSTTLCVAPVVDGNMAPEDPVGFFAVGMGCCGWRGSFTCDDVADADAKGGMLLLEPKSLVSPLMSWAVDDAVDFEAYDAAIQLEKAVFGTPVAKHTRLLRWVKDVSKTNDKYRQHALIAALVSCAVMLPVCIFLAALVVYQPLDNMRLKGKQSRVI